MPICTINPSTGKIIQTYQTRSLHEINHLIEQSHHAFLHWRKLSVSQRAMKIIKAAKILLNKKQVLAELITQEMGKPIQSSRLEIEKCAWLCQYYAEQGDYYLNPRVVKTEMRKSYVMMQPTGIIFAIMPWNFPFLQVFRFATINLMLGNGCILKHAPITTGCGLMIEQIFHEAGLTENIFRTCVTDLDLVESIIAHPKVTGVTFTGSVTAGKIVYAKAARYLKKTVLELGGNDPYLILTDADLNLAAEQCVLSRQNNSGQVCIAAKRIIVVDAVKEEFEKKVFEKARKYKYGDPLDESVNLGPLARADLRECVHNQVMGCVAKGAELVMGGRIPEGVGYFYPVTILKNIKPNMPAYDAEIFGPVISFISAQNERDAIRIANDSAYGLSAAIFTQDIERGENIAHEINVGTCFVNKLVASDPRLPFGGIKNSGIGRELAEEGFREFANVKTVCVNDAS